MEHYVGLDVSLKQTAICIVDGIGKVQCEGIVLSDPEAIAAFIKSYAPNVVRIGLETGPTSTWLWTELNKMGLPVICIDARHAKAALKMQLNKSDRNDAIGIARIMQCGWYKEVHVKDLDSYAIKAVLISRTLLVKIKRDIENQISGLLKNLGLNIGPTTTAPQSDATNYPPASHRNTGRHHVRNTGRHHLGTPGRLRRNPQPLGRPNGLWEDWECRAAQNSAKAMSASKSGLAMIELPGSYRAACQEGMAVKARNHPRVASALPHSEGIAFKPLCSEIVMVLAGEADGVD
jgi:hypothetical protein